MTKRGGWHHSAESKIHMSVVQRERWKGLDSEAVRQRFLRSRRWSLGLPDWLDMDDYRIMRKKGLTRDEAVEVLRKNALYSEMQRARLGG